MNNRDLRQEGIADESGISFKKGDSFSVTPNIDDTLFKLTCECGSKLEIKNATWRIKIEGKIVFICSCGKEHTMGA